MSVGQIIRGDQVEVVFSKGVDSLVGEVVNAPHREETHEKLGWIIQDSAGTIYSLGDYAYIKKLS
jgi:L-ascorbate metabolism protein UlaG (beta-lactamase superfamily)